MGWERGEHDGVGQGWGQAGLPSSRVQLQVVSGGLNFLGLSPQVLGTFCISCPTILFPEAGGLVQA